MYGQNCYFTEANKRFWFVASKNCFLLVYGTPTDALRQSTFQRPTLTLA